jgi:glycosyltransferase involved in cell wall biosynthesis
MSDSRKIIWKGFFEGPTGYINACKFYPLALEKAGFNVGISPLQPLSKENPLNRLVCEPKKDDLVILHQIPTVSPQEKGYFTVTEFNLPPPSWWRSLEEAEIIITQSEFCRKIFGKVEGVNKSKVKKVYAPLDPNLSPEGEAFVLPYKSKFIFGSIFEWVARKKPELMWQAFLEEFPADKYPDVYFVNKISIPQGFASWKINFNEATKKDKRIVVVQDKVEDIGYLYRGLDCYCSPTAGEGWGLTLAESMSCGIPTIGSRHSGNLEFMNDNNSYLVDVDNWSYVGDDPTNKLWMVHDFQKWRLPKVESIRQQMRKVYEETMNGTTNPKVQEALKIRELLSMEKIAEQMKEALT